MRTAVHLAAVAAGCVVLGPSAIADVERPAASVSAGQLRGEQLASGGAAFEGIPFAKPPVGPLRWREPEPASVWTGVREATSFGAPCAQNSGGGMLAASSEDCLYLNVWTPAKSASDKLPVFVWFYLH